MQRLRGAASQTFMGAQVSGTVLIGICLHGVFEDDNSAKPIARLVDHFFDHVVLSYSNSETDLMQDANFRDIRSNF
jgi:hypothetical protein